MSVSVRHADCASWQSPASWPRDRLALVLHRAKVSAVALVTATGLLVLAACVFRAPRVVLARVRYGMAADGLRSES